MKTKCQKAKRLEKALKTRAIKIIRSLRNQRSGIKAKIIAVLKESAIRRKISVGRAFSRKGDGW